MLRLWCSTSNRNAWLSPERARKTAAASLSSIDIIRRDPWKAVSSGAQELGPSNAQSCIISAGAVNDSEPNSSVFTTSRRSSPAAIQKNLTTKTRSQEDSHGQGRGGSLCSSCLCAEDRMGALPGVRTKILAGSQRIFPLVVRISPAATETDLIAETQSPQKNKMTNDQ